MKINYSKVLFSFLISIIFFILLKKEISYIDYEKHFVIYITISFIICLITSYEKKDSFLVKESHLKMDYLKFFIKQKEYIFLNLESLKKQKDGESEIK